MKHITGLFHSFEGTRMKRAKVYEFYKLGVLQGIRDLDDEVDQQIESETIWSILFMSFYVLGEFISDAENVALPGALEAAKELRASVAVLIRYEREHKKVQSTDLSLLKGKLSKFENLLEYDLKRLPTFSVEKTGIFDSDDLILHAENHLSATALATVDAQVKDDFQAAGRCLAFDLFTACGFHAVRALEKMARLYHKQVTGHDAEKDGTPLGGVTNDLRDVADDIRGRPPKPRPKDDPLRLVISNLDRMNNIYRKPLTHPEMVLKTRDAAKNVFDLAAASIALISEQIAEPVTNI
jgi:hypothetical protein